MHTEFFPIQKSSKKKETADEIQNFFCFSRRHFSRRDIFPDTPDKNFSEMYDASLSPHQPDKLTFHAIKRTLKNLSGKSQISCSADHKFSIRVSFRKTTTLVTSEKHETSDIQQPFSNATILHPRKALMGSVEG
ncbi:hypothetical protein CEXT_773771 [Caerostris extrusa]|uniref:Uncharacterized protein n=1 Tax=Caerostris extrusa TaxID=172846 RepID=A0AAV4Y172_CAEEX|nr:hypothetical protein CEXT_773771 [Caerostris extrusa]